MFLRNIHFTSFYSFRIFLSFPWIIDFPFSNAAFSFPIGFELSFSFPAVKEHCFATLLSRPVFLAFLDQTFFICISKLVKEIVGCPEFGCVSHLGDGIYTLESFPWQVLLAYAAERTGPGPWSLRLVRPCLRKVMTRLVLSFSTAELERFL